MENVGIVYGLLKYLMAILQIYCHFVYFAVIWYILWSFGVFFRFGMLYLEKSVNLDFLFNIEFPFNVDFQFNRDIRLNPDIRYLCII
jgi:hypothetical protein